MAALAAFNAAATAASAAADALGAEAEGVGIDASADGIAAGAGAGAGAGTMTTGAGGGTTTSSFLLQADKAAAATKADKMMAVDLFMAISLVEMKTFEKQCSSLSLLCSLKNARNLHKRQLEKIIQRCSNLYEPGKEVFATPLFTQSSFIDMLKTQLVFSYLKS